MAESIGFVAAGNMAEAMIRGLLRGEVFEPKQIVASAPREVYADVEARVRAVAREHGTPVRLPYVTELYYAFVPS